MRWCRLVSFATGLEVFSCRDFDFCEGLCLMNLDEAKFWHKKRVDLA